MGLRLAVAICWRRASPGSSAPARSTESYRRSRQVSWIRPLLGSSLSVRPLEDGMDIPKQSRADRYESFYREFDSPLMQKIRRETVCEDVGLQAWGSAEEMRADVARLNVSSSSRIVDLGAAPAVH